MGSFRHGVASGDPGATSVVLWTRVSAAQPTIRWSVALDPRLDHPVAGGVVDVDVDVDDGTVRVVVEGLTPATTYWYGFITPDGDASPVGRTRTLPHPDDPVASLRIGVVCCARYGSGWFDAYRVVAELEPDLVVHLGDYIYEDGDACIAGREHDPPTSLHTLDDYRRRHAQAKTDPDLQALHAAAPTVVLWDDHEFADNAWLTGAAAHDHDEDGSWTARVAAARQAWMEWMPFTRQRPADIAIDHGVGELDRRLRIGTLCDLVVIDTRIAGRDTPAHTGGAPTVVPVDRRTLLSVEQRDWLNDRLAERHTTYRLLANQVHIGPMHLVGAPGISRGIGPLRPVVNPDQWDGYPHERELLLAALRTDEVRGVIALSGDLHASFVRTVNDRSGPVMTEVTTPSVSAPTFGAMVAARTRGLLRPALLERLLRTKNTGIRFLDTRRHGATVLDVAPEATYITVHHTSEADRPARVHRFRVTPDDCTPRPIAPEG